MLRHVAAASLLLGSALPVVVRAQEPDTIPRSAAGAAVLSLLLPGLGSADVNGKHAAIHGIIAGGAFIGLVATMARATKHRCTDYDCPGGTAVGYAMLAYLVNDFWSVFTAVDDVDSFNEALRKRSASGVSLSVRNPQLFVARDPGGGRRVSVQLLRATF
jgi:hypothetical protein